MATHHLELSDEVYRKLQRAADIEGLTPEEWIGVRLPAVATEERSLAESLKGLVGIVDSRTDPPYRARRTAIGDYIADKFVKQGIGTGRGNPD